MADIECPICGKTLTGRQFHYSDETGEREAFYDLSCTGSDDGHFYGVHADDEETARRILSRRSTPQVGRGMEEMREIIEAARDRARGAADSMVKSDLQFAWHCRAEQCDEILTAISALSPSPPVEGELPPGRTKQDVANLVDAALSDALVGEGDAARYDYDILVEKLRGNGLCIRAISGESRSDRLIRKLCNQAPESPGCIWPKCDCGSGSREERSQADLGEGRK